MTDKELRKLKRADLLEILIVQSREIDRLRAELRDARLELSERRQSDDRRWEQMAGVLRTRQAARETVPAKSAKVQQMYEREEES